MSGEIMERFTQACEGQIRSSPHAGRRADTVFFGGGTPTFLGTEQLLRLLRAVLETFDVSGDAEITSEANPGTADAEKFAAMRLAGFNRLSIGAQSFRDDDLIRLERVHTASEIERAYVLAREAGFDNVNLDLMFALPKQPIAAWRENLQRAISLGPEHLSLYCLTIEPQTKFDKLRRQGMLPLPEEDEQVAMQILARDECAKAGYAQYEISNFALSGRECLHNLIYWHNEEYLGFGPGAVSYMKGERWMNIRHPEKYIQSPAAIMEQERSSEATSLAETIMLGLRLRDGITWERLDARHPGSRDLVESQLAEPLATGWVEKNARGFRLTEPGVLYHNEVAMRFLP